MCCVCVPVPDYIYSNVLIFLVNIYQSAVIKNVHGVHAFVMDLFSVRIGQNFYYLHLEAFDFFFM